MWIRLNIKNIATLYNFNIENFGLYFTDCIQKTESNPFKYALFQELNPDSQYAIGPIYSENNNYLKFECLDYFNKNFNLLYTIQLFNAMGGINTPIYYPSMKLINEDSSISSLNNVGYFLSKGDITYSQDGGFPFGPSNGTYIDGVKGIAESLFYQSNYIDFDSSSSYSCSRCNKRKKIGQIYLDEFFYLRTRYNLSCPENFNQIYTALNSIRILGLISFDQVGYWIMLQQNFL